MNREQIEQHIKDIVMHHYGWDLWASRSRDSYDAGIKPFVDSLADLVEHAQRGEQPNADKFKGPMDDIRAELNVEIWDKVRQLRRAQGIPQTRMAEVMGVDAEYYADLERGAAWMRTIDLRDALTILKVKSSDVLPF